MMVRLLCFAAGALCGVGGATVYFKKKYVKRSDYEKDLADQMKFYEEKTPRRPIVRVPRPEAKPAEETNTPDMNTPYKKPEFHDYREHYSQQAAPVVDPAEEEHPEEDEDLDLHLRGHAATIEHNNAVAEGIIEIAPCDLGTDGYEPVTLLYYTDDGVITTENEECYDDLDEVEAMLGNMIHSTNFDINDDDALYIRNPHFGCDYEIIKVRSSYEEGGE